MKKSILVALSLSILCIGCTNVVEVPKEVYVPVKCKIEKTNPPINKAKDENDFEGIRLNNEAILIYTEIIEEDINFCVEGILK